MINIIKTSSILSLNLFILLTNIFIYIYNDETSVNYSIDLILGSITFYVTFIFQYYVLKLHFFRFSYLFFLVLGVFCKYIVFIGLLYLYTIIFKVSYWCIVAFLLSYLIQYLLLFINKKGTYDEWRNTSRKKI
jgi:hypothetical protein